MCSARVGCAGERGNLLAVPVAGTAANPAASILRPVDLRPVGVRAVRRIPIADNAPFPAHDCVVIVGGTPWPINAVIVRVSRTPPYTDVRTPM